MTRAGSEAKARDRADSDAAGPSGDVRGVGSWEEGTNGGRGQPRPLFSWKVETEAPTG